MKQMKVQKNNRHLSIFGIVTLLVIISGTVFFIFARSVTAITSESMSYFIDEFSLEKHKVEVQYRFGESKVIPLRQSMLSVDDANKLKSTGKHKITITYHKKQIVVSITIYEMIVEDYLFASINDSQCMVIGYTGESSTPAIKNIYENKIVVGIAAYAFEGSLITSIYLSSSVEFLDDYAFSDCKKLKTINLDNILDYGMGVFSNCLAITSVVLSEELRGMGMGVFYNCQKLKEISMPFLPEGYLGYIFGGYSSLENSAVVPKSLEMVTVTKKAERIEQSSYFECASLKAIIYQNGANELVPGAFEGTSSLENIEIRSQNFRTIEGILYNYEQSVIYLYPSGKKIDYYIVPDGVTEIAGYAFARTAMKTLNLDGTEMVGEFAFSNCKSLKEIIFSKANYLSSGAFYGCESLKEVRIDSTIHLESMVFGGCGNLEVFYLNDEVEIEFADSVTNTDYNKKAPFFIVNPDNMDYYNNDEAWKFLSDYIYPSNYSLSNNSVFSYLISDVIVIIDLLIDTDHLQIPEYFDGVEVTEIGPRAFLNKTFKTIDLGGIITIKEFAFLNLDSLVEVSTSKLQKINTGAFFGCSNLSYLDLSRCGYVEVDYLDASSISENTLDHNMIVEVNPEFLAEYHDDQNWVNFGHHVISEKGTILENEDYRYLLVDCEIYLVKCLSFEGIVDVPDYIDGIKVVGIVSSCYVNLSFETLNFQGEIAFLDDYPLVDCSALTTVLVPHGLVEFYQTLFVNAKLAIYSQMICLK